MKANNIYLYTRSEKLNKMPMIIKIFYNTIWKSYPIPKYFS